MTAFTKILTGPVLFIPAFLYAFLPSMGTDRLMNGTQSGKTILFLAAVLLLTIFAGFWFLFICRTKSFRFGLPDLLITVWSIYLFVTNWLKAVPFSLTLFEFAGLLLLYLILRQVRPPGYFLLFLALIAGGGIQAVYGNLQLWGRYPSHHSLFKMTGSFFNPGPYAGYLASVFPVALGFYLFRINSLSAFTGRWIEWSVRLKRMFLVRIFSVRGKKDKFPAEKDRPSGRRFDPVGTMVILSVIFIALVLPASRSRAAWLAVCVSSGYLLVMKYPVREWILRHLDSRVKRTAALVASIVVLGACFSGLYFLKKGSADGRALVWKVTLDLIGDHPVTGVGFDQFKAHYMDYQAAYFESHPGSEEALVAGDTNYAFNEPLQQTAENGLLGMILEILTFLCLFVPIALPGTGNQLTGQVRHSGALVSRSGREPDHHKIFRVTAGAGVLSILVFALFSYPLQILPIKMNLVFYMAVLSGQAPQRAITIEEISGKSRSMIIRGVKTLLFFILLLVIAAGLRSLYRYQQAYRDWQEAFRVYQMGAYEASLEDYEKVWPALHDDGDYLTNYGKALSMAGQHQKAVDVLLQAAVRYPNTVVCTALGDSYKAQGEAGKAEQAYQHAWYMNPSRFYPKYLLAKLYDETGQREKAVTTAKELLDKEIKIKSIAIEEIKAEMAKIIANQGLNP